MRVVVLGTGALGCLFAARLAAHAETWMLGTWAEGVAAARAHGIRVHGLDGRTWQVGVNAASDPAQVPPADVALLLVKSYQTDRAAAWAAQVLARDGLALTLQNGLDNAPRLVAAVGAARAGVGVTFEGATLLGPAEVRHAGHGPTLVGVCPENGPVAQSAGLPLAVPQAQSGGLRYTFITRGAGRGMSIYPVFVDLLCRAGFDARVATDIEGVLWGKAVINAAINPLTALWRVPNGDLLANAERHGLLLALAHEAAAVAAARGVTLPYPDHAARVEEVCRATAANRSSMLQDVERGRPTEIDSINGVIVAEGRRLGVPTPLNEAVWRLVKGLVTG